MQQKMQIDEKKVQEISRTEERLKMTLNAARIGSMDTSVVLKVCWQLADTRRKRFILLRGILKQNSLMWVMLSATALFI